MSRSEQLVECEVCGAVQVVDLRQFKGKAVTCTQCAAPLDIADLRQQFRAEPDAQVYTGHRIQVQTYRVDLSGAGKVAATTGAAAATGGMGCGCLILSIVLISIGLPLLFATGLITDLRQELNNMGIGTPEMSATQQLQGHASSVNALAYSADGRYLASGEDNGSVWVWDLQAGGTTVINSLESFDTIEDIAFSPDSKLMAVASREAVTLYEMPGGKRLNRQFSDYYFTPNAVAFSPDGTRLAIADSDTGIYDVQTGRLLLGLEMTSIPNDLVFSPDGMQLVTVSWSDGPMVWDTQRGLLLNTIGDTSGSDVSVSLSPDGQKLAFNGTSEFFIYDFTTSTLDQIDIEGISSPRYVAFSPDGAYLAVGDFFDKVTLWEVAGRNITHVLKTTSTVNRIAYSPDGSTVAAATQNGTVQVWTVFPEKQSVAAAPVPTSTPAQITCFISTQNDLRLADEPGQEALGGYLRADIQAEVDGQRSLNDVAWWHLRSGGWARSDFVNEDANCANVGRM